MRAATLPPNKEPNYLSIIKWVIAAAVLLAFMLHFSGCSPLSKAIQKVEVNASAFNKVGADWAKLNPCVTDSVVSLKHDTINTTDTAYQFLPGIHLVHDNYIHDTVIRTVTKLITIHDSVKVVKVDEGALQRLADSLYSYKLALAGAKGASDTITGQLKNSRNIWRIIALAAIGVLLTIIGLKVVHFFKVGGLKALFTNI
jgi:hypothetical protein